VSDTTNEKQLKTKTVEQETSADECAKVVSVGSFSVKLQDDCAKVDSAACSWSAKLSVFSV